MARLWEKFATLNQQKKMGDHKRELARLCQLVTEALKEEFVSGKLLLGDEVLEFLVLLTVVQIQQVQIRFDVNRCLKLYKRDMDRLSNELYVREEVGVITYTAKPGTYHFFSDGYLGAAGMLTYLII